MIRNVSGLDWKRKKAGVILGDPQAFRSQEERWLHEEPQTDLGAKRAEQTAGQDVTRVVNAQVNS